MYKKFINEFETFAVNENFSIEVVKVGPNKRTLGIIDNFYKNPNLVRDLALSIPPTTNERILTRLPAGPDSGRINAFYILDHLGPVYDKIIKELFPDFYDVYEPDAILRVFRDSTFMVNVMTSNNLPPRPPHIDHPNPMALASSVYLNLPEECAGGTSFYTFNGLDTGVEYGLCAGSDDIDCYVADSTGDWNLEYIAEMKFNRMIIYPAAMYHAAYVKPGMFVNGTYRLNQQFFI
jgi:hypothetical protein